MVARVYAKEYEIRNAHTDIVKTQKIHLEYGWDLDDNRPKEIFKLVGGADNISKCYISHHHIGGGSGYRRDVYGDCMIIGDSEDNHIELKGIILHDIASKVVETLELEPMKGLVEFLTAKIKRKEEDRKNGKW